METIARFRSDFPEKFGIPRQSSLTSLTGKIIFEKKYRAVEAVRCLDEFSYIWILWEFSENLCDKFSPTIRPPKLGGNKRVGVFASRSPFRPNNIGLSSVKLLKIDTKCEAAPIIYVEGADIMDNTPIFDIKPYIPYTDCHTDALSGYSVNSPSLKVNIPESLLEIIPHSKRKGLIEALENDPRPGYQNSPERIYTMSFSDFEVSFTVDKHILTVANIHKRNAR